MTNGVYIKAWINDLGTSTAT